MLTSENIHNMFHVSITDLPPEMFNMVCKTLSWKDIKCLEEVLPPKMFITSGVRSDALEMALAVLKEHIEAFSLERKECKKQLEDCVNNYYLVIRNYQIITFHSLHSLLNDKYEQVIRCENLLREYKKVLKNLKKEFKNILEWYYDFYE